ncbi:hypothetical protein [Hyphomonas sp.]|jgi:hypothetical protein|uniref:hypothetical protein n=1 Tax=Hyphomonas sp. TaxID=87 RepID=UPI000C8FB844|nr:hypothetical protein [Hyphomonas sp.]MAL44190.1 hypothetical protein [Hyphomonas sp.]
MKSFIQFVTEITKMSVPEHEKQAELGKAARVMGRKLTTFKGEPPARFTYRATSGADAETRKREIAAAAAPSQGVAGGGY